MKKLVGLLVLVTMSVSGQNLFKDFDYVTVEGRVVTRSGEPVVDCNVEIRTISQGGSDVTLVTTGTRDETKLDKAGWGRTDDKGVYSIKGIPAPGSYLIVVKGVKGYKKAQMPLRIDKSGETTIKAQELVLDLFKQKVDKKTRKLLTKASKAIGKDDLVLAESLLNEAKQRQPELSEIYVSLGNIYLKQRKADDALNAFTKAFEYGEKNIQLCMTAAQLAFRSQKFSDVVQFADAVLNQEPGHLQALYMAGVANYNLQQFESASVYFKQYTDAREGAQSDVNLLYVYGMTEMELGHEAGAALLLHQAYKQGGKADVGFMKMLANMYIKQKMAPEAKAVLKDLLDKFGAFEGRDQAEQVYNSL